MTINEFKMRAHESRFNTNNAWGFGGSVGSKYVLGKFQYVHRKLCYRHAASNKVTEYFINGKEVSKDVFEYAINNECFELYKWDGTFESYQVGNLEFSRIGDAYYVSEIAENDLQISDRKSAKQITKEQYQLKLIL